jgi:hypothetical protein
MLAVEDQRVLVEVVLETDEHGLAVLGVDLLAPGKVPLKP